MERLIIRPRDRWLAWQLVAAIGLSSFLVLTALIIKGRAQAALLTSVAVPALLVMAALHVYWLRRRAPQAVVTTTEYVAVLDLKGKRTYLRWDEVGKASHAATLVGLRWQFSGARGKLVVRDLGVDPVRWAKLWRRVYTELEGRGVPLRVDLLSYVLYKE